MYKFGLVFSNSFVYFGQNIHSDSNLVFLACANLVKKWPLK
jgi:hypothetical protein